MHSEVNFSIEIKTAAGKGAARKSRADGRVPGVVYGYNTGSTMITFEERELVKALSTPAGRNVFLRIQSEDEKINGSRALVKELQVHPLKRRFVHADFFLLDPDRAISATVPIKLEGTAVGVKLGGIMQVARFEIPVQCKPDDLPEAIVVDVTAMKPGDSIHIRDLEAPEGVEFLLGDNLTVCAIVAPSKEETAEGEEGEEAESAEETEGSEESTEE